MKAERTAEPRVLCVIPSLAARNGGPSFAALGYARSVRNLGATVALYTTDASTPAQARSARGGVTMRELPPDAAHVPVHVFPLRHPYRWAYCPSLSRALNRDVRRYDVMHIHSVNLHTQFAAWRAATRAGVPYVVSPHGALDPYIRGGGHWRKSLMNGLWQRRMLDGAAAIHFTTDDELRLVADLEIRAPHHIVPNGVYLPDFAAPPGGAGARFRRRCLQGFEGPLVLNHGRVTEKKGLDILVAAMVAVRAIYPAARLALVGADDEGLGAQLLDSARRLGVADAVTLVGHLTGTDLRDALAAADVWALPSRSENFGIAVVEALAAGRPVITSPQVNIAPEAAAAEALIVVENTPETVADAIIRLLAEPQRAEALAQRGRIYAQRYDWSVVGREVLELYSTAASRGGGVFGRRSGCKGVA